MPVQLVHGDVLDAPASALILTMDGTKRGMEGAIGRAFARRWPDAFSEIEDHVSYPVPLGRTVPTWPESECPFEMVLMASTLHHLEMLSDSQKASVVESALSEALILSNRHRCHSLASAVMSGGWRLPFRKALSAMLDTAQPLTREGAVLSLSIYVLGEREFANARELAAAKNIALTGTEQPRA